jgi:hypothetical protein
MQLRNDIPDGRVGYSSVPDAFSLEERLNQKYLQPHDEEAASCVRCETQHGYRRSGGWSRFVRARRFLQERNRIR